MAALGGRRTSAGRVLPWPDPHRSGVFGRPSGRAPARSGGAGRRIWQLEAVEGVIRRPGRGARPRRPDVRLRAAAQGESRIDRACVAASARGGAGRLPHRRHLEPRRGRAYARDRTSPTSCSARPTIRASRRIGWSSTSTNASRCSGTRASAQTSRSCSATAAAWRSMIRRSPARIRASSIGTSRFVNSYGHS